MSHPSLRRTLGLTPALVATLVFAPAVLSAQTQPGQPSLAQAGQNSFTAGFGMTVIDGQRYYLVSAAPELAFGRFGLGLDLNLRVDADSQQIREEDWNEWTDALNSIRYLRYGSQQGGGPLYAQLGELDRARLGYGQVMYMYHNSPSYDARKRGVEANLDFGAVGVQSVYGNLAEAEVAGGRVYVRPLHHRALPILSRIQFGASAVADFSDQAGLVNGVDAGTPTVFGYDVGLPVVETPMAMLTLYVDGAKIRDAGSGHAVGTQLDLAAIGVARVAMRFEHRIIGDRYMPSYFNSSYELERFREESVGGVPVRTTRYEQVLSMTNTGNGAYGEISGDVVNVLRMTGSYQRLYEHSNSGWLHVDVGTGDRVPHVVLRGSYDRWNMGSETDLLTLDDRSMARLETGYRPTRWLTISALTEWTFSPVRDENGDVLRFEPQKRVEPKISFGFQF